MAQAYFSLAAICLIWGTTYVAIKFAVLDFPPYLMVGIRQTTAGLLILGWAALNGKLTRPTWSYTGRQALTGLFLITGGNGFISWGMQYVSAGIASIIGALTPMVVLLMSLMWRGSERPGWTALAGVLLGSVGLGLVFHDGWRDFANPVYVWGIAGCFGSCLTWSLGTVMAKRYNDPGVSPLLNAGLQIIAGGLGGFVLSLFLDTHHTIRHTWQGWAALAYLTLIGSALAFSLYMVVLRHLSATAASIYTYINPIVAVFLGWLWLGEHLSWGEVTGMGIALAGVWLVNKGG